MLMLTLYQLHRSYYVEMLADADMSSPPCHATSILIFIRAMLMLRLRCRLSDIRRHYITLPRDADVTICCVTMFRLLLTLINYFTTDHIITLLAIAGRHYHFAAMSRHARTC